VKEKIEKFKLPLGLSLVGIVLIIGGIFASGISKPQSKVFPQESLISEKMISIDVSGAVNNPGVYQVKEGARIEDAIKAAGGFTQDANQEYISKSLNLAQKIVDGSKIYVPVAGESKLKSTWEVGPDSSQVSQVRVVNINTASQSELEALPGIGPVTASKIISDRPYQVVDDLLSKKVINKSTFEKIKDQLVLY